MNDMLLPRRVIKFTAKLVEVNRQYELNNNAELDNGVYHYEDDSQDGEKENADEHDESSGGHARTG